MEIYLKCYESVKKKSLIEQRHLVVYRVANVGLVVACTTEVLAPRGIEGRLVYSAIGSQRLVMWWLAQIEANGLRLLNDFRHGRVIEEESLSVVKEICLLKPNFKWYNRDFTDVRS